MRKFFISLTFLGVFILYSIGIRHQRPTISRPQNLRKQTTNSISYSNVASISNSSTNSSGTTKTARTSYKDGNYTGSSADAYWGPVQVQAVIKGGKISNIKFLSYPNSHPASVYINQQVMSYLKQETIKSQNANVQIISGATFTSEAFIQSLTNALSKS